MKTEADKRRHSDFYDQIVKFKYSSDKELNLCGLNSFERQMVHEIADELQIGHSSHGEGKSRILTLTKPEEPIKETKPKVQSTITTTSEPAVEEESKEFSFQDLLGNKKASKKQAKKDKAIAEKEAKLEAEREVKLLEQ